MKVSKVNFDNTAKIRVGDTVEVIAVTCPIKKGVINTVKAVDHYNGMTRILVSGIWLFGNEVKVVVKNTENKSALSSLTVKELREKAKKIGIKNTSKLNKAELVSSLEYTYQA